MPFSFDDELLRATLAPHAPTLRALTLAECRCGCAPAGSNRIAHYSASLLKQPCS